MHPLPNHSTTHHVTGHAMLPDDEGLHHFQVAAMSSGCTLLYLSALEGDYDLYRWLLTDAGQRWLDERYASQRHLDMARSEENVESRSCYRRSTTHAAAVSGDARILWDVYTRCVRCSQYHRNPNRSNVLRPKLTPASVPCVRGVSITDLDRDGCLRARDLPPTQREPNHPLRVANDPAPIAHEERVPAPNSEDQKPNV